MISATALEILETPPPGWDGIGDKLLLPVSTVKLVL